MDKGNPRWGIDKKMKEKNVKHQMKWNYLGNLLVSTEVQAPFNFVITQFRLEVH